jgi:hypothetical protein
MEMTLSQEDIDIAIRKLAGGNAERICFESRLNRDEVFRQGKAQGLRALKKQSAGYSILDPRYTFEGRHLPDKGLGNDQRGYAKLYFIYSDDGWWH